jgi:hypothetical protein
MTRSTQTGPDLFSASELVDAPLFDLDTDNTEVTAPAEDPAEWDDRADVDESDPWIGATVLTVDADLNVVSYPYEGQGAWLEVPQDTEEPPPGWAVEAFGEDAEGDTDEDPDEDDDEGTEDDEDDTEALDERQVVLEWTVTKTYRWEGLVGELPPSIQSALRPDTYDGTVTWDEGADEATLGDLASSDTEEDTDTELDAVYEV